MCTRQCPCCGHREHVATYGLFGSTILCNRCHAILALRPDIEAAPPGMTEEEAEAWVAEGSFVLEGAEAADPKDDEMFGPRRAPVTFLAW